MDENATKPIDEPRSFDVAQLFFSTTDLKGIITGCNDVFVDIAAFTSEELLKQPHSIIRHPDMPRAVFSLLWDTSFPADPLVPM